MQLRETNQEIEAHHGVVSSFPSDFFGYFGWPTLARMEDGTLVAAASGLRNAHVCPFGRNVICTSRDQGQTWTSPQVANDSPLDDRDTGVVPLGGDRLLISWFTTDERGREDRAEGEQLERWRQGYARVSDESAARWVGAWILTSHDRGESWNAPVKVPLTAPHGPIRLHRGELLYFGKEFLVDMEGFAAGQGAIAAMKSTDEGRTWERLGTVPLYEGTVEGNYHEPHVSELPDGKLVGLIRLENHKDRDPIEELGLIHFSLMQTTSKDGGRTWSPAEPLNFHGCPPHLLYHSSGALICSYGFRQPPYGERLMISRDGGASWDYHYILRDDGPDSDLGYPSTVELADGSLLTMYYQKPESVEDKCSLLWSHWELPD
jgi:hypothetical protein